MPRAWVIHEYSGYQGLALEEFDTEEPGPGEIRLRIEAFALKLGRPWISCMTVTRSVSRISLQRSVWKRQE